MDEQIGQWFNGSVEQMNTEYSRFRFWKLWVNKERMEDWRIYIRISSPSGVQWIDIILIIPIELIVWNKLAT